jgi:WD40 repeat protein
MPGEDHSVQVWDLETSHKRCLLSHPGTQRALAFSPDGERIATGGDNQEARLWDLARGRPSGSPLRHDAEVSAAAFSPDGRTLWTGTALGTVTRWDAAAGNHLGQFRAHEFPIWSVAQSPDGRWFVTGSADQTARVWDAVTGELRATLRHQGQVWSVAFSPPAAGRRETKRPETVLTGSEDGTARLWEAPSGQPLGAPFRAGMRVRTAAFSPDGRVVVLGSWEGVARLWDVPTRQPLAAPVGSARGPVLAAAFVEAGAQVRTAAEDKTVLRWRVPAPAPGTAERVLLWAQVISGMELEPGGAARVLDAPTWQERQGRLQQLGGPPL